MNKDYTKCVFFKITEQFPKGECSLEMLEWGYPYYCNHRNNCPDFKLKTKK